MTTDDDAKAAAVFGSLLSQVMLEALVATGKLTLADAVNVLVQVRDLAKAGTDPTHDLVVQAARTLEMSFRKRLAEAEARQPLKPN